MAEWTEEELEKIWEKATKVDNYDSDVWRKDQCGAWISHKNHGKASPNESHTSYKWQVDHIKPDSKGGEDIISNVRPLQWYNNVYRQNGRLKTKITADCNKNIELPDK